MVKNRLWGGYRLPPPGQLSKYGLNRHHCKGIRPPSVCLDYYVPKSLQTYPCDHTSKDHSAEVLGAVAEHYVCVSRNIVFTVTKPGRGSHGQLLIRGMSNVQYVWTTSTHIITFILDWKDDLVTKRVEYVVGSWSSLEFITATESKNPWKTKTVSEMI